jgi:hypothetical protein
MTILFRAKFLELRPSVGQIAFVASLSIGFVSLTGCTGGKDAPPSRVSAPMSSEAAPKTAAKPMSTASELVVETQASMKGLVPISLLENTLLLSGADDKHYRISLDKPGEAPSLLPVEDLDGIRADGVLFKIPTLDSAGKQSDWFIFDDEAKGNPQNALIALREPSGEVVFLEQGRKWFAATSKSSMQIIIALPQVVVLRENNSLMVIQKSNPTFSLTKVEIDFVDRVMSIGSNHVIYLGKDQKLHLVTFDIASTPAKIAQKDLELANIEAVVSAGFLPEKNQIMTFSGAGNKLLDLASGEYTLFKKYTGFATHPKSILMPYGADTLISTSPESEVLEKLTHSSTSDKNQ